MFGLVMNRLGKITEFGLTWGKGLSEPHPAKYFNLGIFPGLVGTILYKTFLYPGGCICEIFTHMFGRQVVGVIASD